MAYQFTRSGSIVLGQTMSNPIQLNEGCAVGIITGSNVTATSLTFLVSADGVTYAPLYDDASTEVSLTTTTSARAYNLSVVDFFPWNFLRVVEGTSASNVTQKIVDTLFTVNVKII